ncbi:Formylglycine-generating enzyme [Geodia barretti]|uniref:Formylglycine-generating enzyme n=1 Tax=Geodia barretti TaxID=519541 RepID=A0AA35WVQ8_GEOBA|nr:Formylglycine-generating enzyme [Geodia barretti]
MTEEHRAVFEKKGMVHDGTKRSQIVPFIDQSERLCTLLDHPKVLEVIGSLLGEDFNYVGGDGNYYSGDTGWHSDGAHKVGLYAKFHLYLDPLTRDTGCIRVIPGSHLFGEWRARIEQVRRSNEALEVNGSDVPCVAVETEPGDVVVFNHNIYHASFGGGRSRRHFDLNVASRAKTDTEIAELDSYLHRDGKPRFTLCLSGCGEDDEVQDEIAAIIPINFSNLKEAGEYAVRITITGPNVATITTEQNLSIKPTSQPVEEIALSEVHFGANQVVTIEVLKGGTVLYQGEAEAGFIRNSSNRTIEITKWDWGDGQQTKFGEELTASHTYERVGEYTIILTVRNDAPNPITVEQEKTISVTAELEIVSKSDGTTMMLIPTGTFEMGDSFGEGLPHELPVHTVSVNAFYMDVTEVTNAVYKQFLDATGHKAPDFWEDPTFNALDQPVVGDVA